MSNFVHCRFPVHGKVAARELFSDPWSHHVNTKNLSGSTVGVFLGDDLHESVNFANDHCATIGTELMLCNHNVVASSFCSFFTRSSPCNFRAAINCPWHFVVVNRNCGLTKNLFHHKNCFCICNVSKLWRVDQVANRKDIGNVGAAIRINVNKSAIAHCNLCICKSQLIRKRTTADRNDDCINFKLFTFTKRNNC
ncbi:unannotated protein [freshwater metagenome]|uniref:Unannotated protein n=1 Tax=freshwater metagenome TaxID=449393 RepID=A0A6J6VQ99_9ZZZZ